MAFRIKKVRPLFTGVITTAKTYVGDVYTEAGLLDITRKDGDLNPYQWVEAVGTTVTGIKPGDIVKLNFKRYAMANHKPGAIDDAENKQYDNLTITYNLPTIKINGQTYLFMQNNDIEYVVEEFDGVDEGGLLQ